MPPKPIPKRIPKLVPKSVSPALPKLVNVPYTETRQFTDYEYGLMKQLDMHVPNSYAELDSQDANLLRNLLDRP
jgi:hypothetical protein